VGAGACRRHATCWRTCARPTTRATPSRAGATSARLPLAWTLASPNAPAFWYAFPGPQRCRSPAGCRGASPRVLDGAKRVPALAPPPRPSPPHHARRAPPAAACLGEHAGKPSHAFNVRGCRVGAVAVNAGGGRRRRLHQPHQHQGAQERGRIAHLFVVVPPKRHL
jgi:hypothetical protein